MKILSGDQMRELDQRTMTEGETPGETLMDRAGYGVARAAWDLADMAGYSGFAVQIFAGRGNNGGDAFVAARYLKQWGAQVDVWLAGEKRMLRGDALTHFSKLRAADITVNELATLEDCEDFELGGWEGGIIIDGILGVGVRGPARGPAVGAIRCVNRLGHRGLVVSIDLPSGLDTDTGEACGDAVHADLTATIGYPKHGLAQRSAMDHVGSVEVVDIGIPPEFAESIRSDLELITADDVRYLFTRRARDTHKGSYGHALLIGGSPGYAGAIALAARAALRSGVGLVSVLTPASVAPIVAGLVPEAMVHPAPETDGALAPDCLERWGRDLSHFTAILAGPGMPATPATRRVTDALLARAKVALALDAGALAVYAGDAAALRAAQAPLSLTPHPGEMGQLLGRPAANVQANREECARLLARQSNAVVALKGAGTLVARAEGPLHINLTGNPGMATGGSGDVLAGVLAAFLAQGMNSFEALRSAVLLHGHAGDLAAWEHCQMSMTAGDIVHALHDAFRLVTPR